MACWFAAETFASEVACVTNLQEVFSRIGVLDACVRMVFQSQADLVFALFAKQVTDAEMTGKVVSGREVFVVCQVETVDGIAHTDTRLHEPGRLTLTGSPAQCGLGADDPGVAPVALVHPRPVTAPDVPVARELAAS